MADNKPDSMETSMTAVLPSRTFEREPAPTADTRIRPSVAGTSWGAIFAGAVAAASLSLILLVLGTGLGFSAMSPWSDRGADASTLGISAIAWLVLTSIAASGIGGYLAGRLRVKWSGVHTDESYFRDTAHGFVAWGVATLTVAALLSSAAGSVVKGGAQVGADAAGAMTQAGAMGIAAMAPGVGSADGGSLGYSVDALFRGDPSAAPAGETNDGALRSEATKIVGSSLRNGEMTSADRSYLAGLVAKRTGLSAADAEKRVADAYAKLTQGIADAQAKAKQAAETARKNAAYGALWMFVALLAGAFVASLSATFGGRRRDGFD